MIWGISIQTTITIKLRASAPMSIVSFRASRACFTRQTGKLIKTLATVLNECVYQGSIIVLVQTAQKSQSWWLTILEERRIRTHSQLSLWTKPQIHIIIALILAKYLSFLPVHTWHTQNLDFPDFMSLPETVVEERIENRETLCKRINPRALYLKPRATCTYW